MATLSASFILSPKCSWALTTVKNFFFDVSSHLCIHVRGRSSINWMVGRWVRLAKKLILQNLTLIIR